jgi:hypothetical protein
MPEGTAGPAGDPSASSGPLPVGVPGAGAPVAGAAGSPPAAPERPPEPPPARAGADGTAEPPEGQGEDPAALRGELATARQADRSKGQRIRQLEGELDTLRREAMSEQERAVADARAEARREAEAEWRGRYLTLRVERLAATRLADPADAVHLLDLTDVTHETEDAVITGLLDALLTAKPYLAARGGTIPPPVLDRGPQNGAPKPGTNMNDLIRGHSR